MPRASLTMVAVALAALSTVARAQEAASEPVPPPASPPPPAVPAPSAPPVVAAAEERAVLITDDDRIFYGTPKQQLTPVQLFEATGRQDLVERARANLKRRTVLFITAGALAAVALAVGVGFLATSPVMGGSSRCNDGDLGYYNSYCQPQWVLHQQVGTATLVTGLAAAGILASFGYWARPDVLTPFELRKFIRQYNASLSEPPASLRLVPWVSPDGAGLTARATF
jgi:hypothetical protein